MRLDSMYPAESMVIKTQASRERIVAELHRQARSASIFDAERALNLAEFMRAGGRSVIFGGVRYEAIDGDPT